MNNLATKDKKPLREAIKGYRIDFKGDDYMKKRIIIQIEESKKELLQKKATEQ